MIGIFAQYKDHELEWIFFPNSKRETSAQEAQGRVDEKQGV